VVVATTQFAPHGARKETEAVNRQFWNIVPGLRDNYLAPKPTKPASPAVKDVPVLARVGGVVVCATIAMALAMMGSHATNLAASAPITGVSGQGDLANSPVRPVHQDSNGTRVTNETTQQGPTQSDASAPAGGRHLFGPIVPQPANSTPTSVAAGRTILVPASQIPSFQPTPSAGTGQILPKPTIQPVQIGDPASAGNQHEAPAQQSDPGSVEQPTPQPSPKPAEQPDEATQPQQPTKPVVEAPAPTPPSVIVPPVVVDPPPVVAPPAPKPVKPPVVVHSPAPKPKPVVTPVKTEPIDTSPATAAFDNSDGAGHGTTSSNGATPVDPGHDTAPIDSTVHF
jgi:hypothetical protein